MILTIDVGGTKTLVATFSDSGEMQQHSKFPTPKIYAEFIQLLQSTISEVCDSEKPSACAIAMPARVDRNTGTAIAFGNLDWENVPIAHDLSSVVTCPIYLENDANLAGLAEATGVLDHYRKTLYVTVSTGIGGAFVIDGKLDPDTIDGEIGQTLLEHNGRLMRWEEFASGKAIVAQTGKMASEITDESDWYLVARNIAIGLINIIATLTPECVIIGGGVGSHLEKFHEKLHDELELYSNDMMKIPQIRKAQHPEEAVVYGGYLLCKQHETNQSH